MTTHSSEEELWDFIDQGLPVEDNIRIKTHLEVCSTCQQLYQVQFSLHQELNALAHETPSADFSQQVMSKIDRTLEIERSMQFWLRFTKYAIAGALTLVTFILILILGRQKIDLPLVEMEFTQYLYLLLITSLMAWIFYGLDFLFVKLSEKTW